MAFTSLGWTKLSSPASSISMSIPSGYEDILVRFAVRGDRSTEDYLIMRVNGSSSTQYSWGILYTNGSDMFFDNGENSGLNSETSFRVGFLPPSGTDVNNYATGTIQLFAYANTSYMKNFKWHNAYENNVTSGDVKSVQGGGIWGSTSTVTSLSLQPAFGSNLIVGSAVGVYGYTSS